MSEDVSSGPYPSQPQLAEQYSPRAFEGISADEIIKSRLTEIAEQEASKVQIDDKAAWRSKIEEFYERLVKLTAKFSPDKIRDVKDKFSIAKQISDTLALPTLSRIPRGLLNTISDPEERENILALHRKLYAGLTGSAYPDVRDEVLLPEIAQSLPFYQKYCSVKRSDDALNDMAIDLVRYVKSQLLEIIPGILELLELKRQGVKHLTLSWEQPDAPLLNETLRNFKSLESGMHSVDSSYFVATDFSTRFDDAIWLAETFSQMTNKGFETYLENYAPAFEPRENDSKIAKKTALAHDEFRISTEARVLRLCKLIESRSDISAPPNSAESKIARQLLASGLDGARENLAEFASRLKNHQNIAAAIEQIFSTIEGSSTNSVVTPAPTVPSTSLVEHLPDSATSVVAPSPPYLTPEEELEYAKLLLEDMGVSDPICRQRLSEELNITSLQIASSFLTELPKDVLSALLTENPDIIANIATRPFAGFCKNVLRVISLTKDFSGFEVFDPLRSPEHFANPVVLERTLAAAIMLDKLQTDVRMILSEPSESSTNTSTQSRFSNEQLELIDQLGELTSNRYIAYGIIRFGFYTRGGYQFGGLPQVRRDQQLQSVFERIPHPNLIRQVESELVSIGFLRSSRGARHSDHMLTVTPVREIQDLEARHLLAALTDPLTYPAQAPRLPIEDSQVISRE